MKRPDWLKLSPPVVFGLVVVGVLGLGLVVYLPQWQTAPLSQKIKSYEKSANPDPKELATLENSRINTENAIRTGLIQGIGGTVLLVGLYFTYQNLKATQRNVAIAEDKQVTERFSKAVDMLSSSSMHTRLGGIYALERIAKDSDDDYWQVMEVLTAFVREESPWPPKEANGAGTVEAKVADQVEAPQPVEPLPVEPSVVAVGETSQGSETQPELSEGEQRQKEENQLWAKQEAFLTTLSPLRTDIQAVMTVIGRRKSRPEEGKTQRLDLSRTNLRQLQAQGANLTDIDWIEAHLEGANLYEANLERAYLNGANLKLANLYEANLKLAWIASTDLSQVMGLTPKQLDLAVTDGLTLLPPYLLLNQQPLPATTTPSTASPPNPPAAPYTANAKLAQPTPEPNAEPQPPAT